MQNNSGHNFYRQEQTLPIRRFGIHAPKTATSNIIVTIRLTLFPKISSAKAAYGYLMKCLLMYFH